METVTYKDSSGGYTPNLIPNDGSFSRGVKKQTAIGAGVGLVLLSLSGSGSNMYLPITVVQKTGSSVIESSSFSTKNALSKAFLTAQEQIEDIKFYLGVPITDLAKILHVQRPAIYDWLSGSEPRPANRERIQEVHRISKQWNSMTNQKIRTYLHAPTKANKDVTILDLLSSDTLNIAAISHALESIAAHLNEKLSKAHGKKTANHISQLSAFDQLSRKITDS